MSAAQQERELTFNTSPDAVLISRLSDGQVEDTNAGFTALTGFTRAEVQGQSTLNLRLWKYPVDRAIENPINPAPLAERNGPGLVLEFTLAKPWSTGVVSYLHPF